MPHSTKSFSISDEKWEEIKKTVESKADGSVDMSSNSEVINKAFDILLEKVRPGVDDE